MTRSLRTVFASLALAAMMLRALVPDGWMPSADGAAHGVSISICTMHGPVRVVLGPDGKPQKPDQNRGHDICPFAAAPHFAAAAASPALAPPLAISFVPVHDTAFRAPARPAVYTPQSPRAPPRLA